MLLLLLPLGVHAVTIVECRDADGTLSYRDTCPPDSQRLATRYLGGAPTRQRPSLDEIARNHPVTLYMVPDCDSCDLVRMLLEQRGIPFKERNVDNDPVLQRELRAVSGTSRVPTVLIGEQAMPGFDRVRLQERLVEVGYPMEANSTTP